MRTHEQESRPFSLGLWMDKASAATVAHELVPLDVLERHLAGERPADEVSTHSHPQWAYLHRPVVPLVDGNTGAGA